MLRTQVVERIEQFVVAVAALFFRCQFKLSDARRATKIVVGNCEAKAQQKVLKDLASNYITSEVRLPWAVSSSNGN
jgi:hypothetical protein